MRKIILLTALVFFALVPKLSGQVKLVKDFTPACDSLSLIMQQRTSVTSELRLKNVIIREKAIDFYFTESLSDLPLKKQDEEFLRKELKKHLPEKYKSHNIENIYSNNIPLEKLLSPDLHNNGKPHNSKYRVKDPKKSFSPLVQAIGKPAYYKGMSGRHIALWQSHGWYYETKMKRWQWQRAKCFRTVEDIYTQSYVLPFLIPMLENAGAYVMTPRERDTQLNEIIADNDSSFADSRTGLIRKKGGYIETGHWKDAGQGFADSLISYKIGENPFTMGTARMAACTKDTSKKAKAIWIPDIPEKGKYAVYISYKSLPKSTSSAHYKVKHLGGVSEFLVNQRAGGGTWIYLGTFEFGPGKDFYVELNNICPEGHILHEGSVVTADAVRLGGGMGKIARGEEDEPDSTWSTSGMPSYLEGALYWMQWAGADTSLTNKFENDYTKDFAGRGAWTSMMAGGSRVNPKQPGKGIPFDLSLAFHSDAGSFPKDSIVGTLAIYTSKCEGKKVFPNGGDRMASREYSDYVQSQIVNDLRSIFTEEWSRRQLWDRSYSESRTTSVPALLLEILSHHNFADMKYGLDPAFRFTVSRAVYKGMLKFLSNRYGCPYAVQPLPVNSFSAMISGESEVTLSWKETVDPLEKTAGAKGFILYTRVDEGTFDNGKEIEARKADDGTYSFRLPIEKGRLYSYRIEAFNEGGKSFPSETLCAGLPENLTDTSKQFLIVNNFDRVSAPAWFDTPEYAGFNSTLDGGVPFHYDISYAGDMYEFRRHLVWISDDNPGFGASFGNEAGKKIAGNNFDYPSIHAKALMAAGYPCSSSSSLFFQKDTSFFTNIWAVDIICGKQVSTISGMKPDSVKYQVFPLELQKALTGFAETGGKIIISGANIGTDVWDQIYPIKTDSSYRANTKKFIQDILGYKWMTNYAGRSGKVWVMKNKHIDTSPIKSRFSFYNTPNSLSYCVETPDGIVPAGENASTFLRYADTNISAGVCYDNGKHKAISLGFPIEAVTAFSDIEKIIKAITAFFEAPGYMDNTEKEADGNKNQA